jgi:xylose isomerase
MIIRKSKKQHLTIEEEFMDIYFPEISNTIRFEGTTTTQPLAFRYYNPDLMVGDKSMKDHLRFAVAYWHTFKGTGADPFGEVTFQRPWGKRSDPIDRAKATMDAAFEFFVKLGVPFYCFHDRDIAPEGESFSESCANLEILVEKAAQLQKATGVRLLWGTANLFSNKRYAHGAGTNPDMHVFAYAAAQVKHAIAATKALDGRNYVFWGGREGYETLLNTDMKKERDQMAAFFHMAVDYAKAIGFTGQFLIEPKPKEPTKHQYDFDSATILNFLREYELLDYFKLNIEANHATLAGHTFAHEMSVASNAGVLGSLDINQGDTLLGWDTDNFPTNIYDAVLAMLVIFNQGGIGKGGMNFDAKPRRGSFDTVDLFYAHISGMDTMARGLLIADKIIKEGRLSEFTADRYGSWSSELGKDILDGNIGFDQLEAFVLDNGEPELKSGRQEYLEGLINSYI